MADKEHLQWQVDRADEDHERAVKALAPWLDMSVAWEEFRTGAVVEEAAAAVTAERDLLLWLHAEAVWRGRVDLEDAREGFQSVVDALQRQAAHQGAHMAELNEEIYRLRREVEFEANAVDWPWTPRGVCACVTEEQATVIRAGGFSRPVCKVHGATLACGHTEAEAQRSIRHELCNPAAGLGVVDGTP